MNYVVIMLIGALAAILANRGIAVFNDGFRPVVPQYLNGEISRKELALMSKDEAAKCLLDELLKIKKNKK